MLRQRDHDRHVRYDGLRHFVDEALALRLELAETVDDDEIGAGRDAVVKMNRGLSEPIGIDRAGLRMRSEILRKLYSLARRQQCDDNSTVCSRLHEPDDAPAFGNESRKKS